ncbi:MAG TPA: VOC family protein [Gemmatimonadaceae bacterium]|nr:VOC family protein [Gemmatimonadaceae bacterium]
MPIELPAATQLGPVTLAVADVERSMRFYCDLVGLAELTRDGNRVSLGAGDAAVLHLVEEPGLKPPPNRASGLYHTAILFPDRATLARVVRHIMQREYPFTGASDHLVSEAFYLDDPDGLGVELYRDRARDKWRWHGDKLEMATLPLNLPDLLSTADREFGQAPPGTRVGHVHLKVSDIEVAERFYHEEMGFDLVTRYGDSATFLAAGGYHHHIGANTWQSKGREAAPPGHAGIRELVIQVPAGATQHFTDPWGLSVRVTSAAP